VNVGCFDEGHVSRDGHRPVHKAHEGTKATKSPS
jgi:hypothetical protein